MKCPECGTETVYREPFCPKCGKDIDARNIKNISEDVMYSFFQKAETEMKSFNNSKKAASDGKIGKLLIGFLLFGALAIAMSFNDGDYDSAVVAIAMTVLFLWTYFMEVEVIRMKTHRLKVVVGIIAFALIIPYFAIYTPMSSYEAKTNPKTVVALEKEQNSIEEEKVLKKEVKEESELTESAIKEEHEDASADESEAVSNQEIATASGEVFITPTGKKYHLERACAGKNAIASLKEDVEESYQPCKKCAQE